MNLQDFSAFQRIANIRRVLRQQLVSFVEPPGLLVAAANRSHAFDQNGRFFEDDSFLEGIRNGIRLSNAIEIVNRDIVVASVTKSLQILFRWFFGFRNRIGEH